MSRQNSPRYSCRENLRQGLRQDLAPASPRCRSHQRGMMVAGTMLVLMSLMAVVLLGLFSAGGSSSSGMMSNADNGLVAASTVDRSIVAINLADAGVEDTILWLSAQSAPPGNTSAFAPSATSFAIPLWSATTQAGSPPRAVVNYPDTNHTFSVTLYPCSGNAGSSQKGFLIESTGSYAGFTQILHVYVTQTSFGHYAWFENNGQPGTWSSNVQSFEGPAHYNTMVGNFYLNQKDGASPIFNYTGPDAFSVGFPLGWKHNNAVTAGPPASDDTAAWNSLASGGPSSVKQSQNQVPIPTSTTDQAKQQTAALGTLSSPPTSAIGATVCPSGGIYIHGDIQQMTLSVSPTNSATQIIELYQIDPVSGADDYEKITLDSSSNQTSIQTGTFTTSGTITLNPPSSWPAASTGLTNGVVYCDGSIGTTVPSAEGGLKGVIADNTFSAGTQTHANALTIATSPTSDIQIDGSLLVNTPRQILQNSSGQYEFHNYHGAVVTSASSAPPSGCVPIYVPQAADTGQFMTQAGELGLVTHNIVYGTYTFNSTGLSKTGYITGMELDAAQFEYGSNGGSPFSYQVPGIALLSMGSNVHSAGTFFNWASCYDDNGYDNRLSVNPPPYYPTTSNRYTIVSWQRVVQSVQ